LKKIDIVKHLVWKYALVNKG